MDPLTGRLTEWLGWKYLTLHRVEERPGILATGRTRPRIPQGREAAGVSGGGHRASGA